MCRVKNLIDIFKSLPMVLSPSYFYNAIPIGFAVSKEPGFLTSEGAILFNPDSHKEQHLKKVDQDARIKAVAWEGQLIEPIWEYNYTRWITIVSLLFFWLYLDLPQYITPTPGYAPTMLLFNFVEYYFPALKDEGPSPFDTAIWQWAFFAFHIIKVAVIYLIFWVGGVNPVSFNPIENRKASKNEITRDKLLNVGWTGSRRATPHEWKEENRKQKIEKAGGIVKAYHAGILTGIGDAGVTLGKGEGWDSSSPTQAEESIAGDEPRKFIVNRRYLTELYQVLASHLNNGELSEEEKGAVIKSFRRGGPEEGPERIKELYAARKLLGNGTITKDTKAMDPTPDPYAAVLGDKKDETK